MAAEKGKGAANLSKDEAETDALFQLPLAEFTPARNALAARMKKAGRGEEAERIKALTKPSVPAWTVNQLYWRRRDAFDALIAAGERFRAAQASQLAGKSADLRGPLDARREVLSELSRFAADTLREAGANPTPDTMRRITTTLEALSTYGALPEAPRAGRLTDDVDPPGFETLAALVPRVGQSTDAGGPSRVIAFQRHTRPAKAAKRNTPGGEAEAHKADRKQPLAAAKAALLETLKAAVQEAEQNLRGSRVAARRAEEALKKAAARTKQAESNKAEAERRLEKAAADVDTARQQARRVAAEAEEAAQVVADAERALDKARRELQHSE
jgi:hypothetical protein